MILEQANGTGSDMAGEPLLVKTAQSLTKLPESSWLHLMSIDNRPVFILSQKLSADETLFLSFPSTMRITELEAKLTSLTDMLKDQKADPSNAILQDLTSTDLKTSHSHQPKQDNFLSIFTDLDKSTIKTYSTPPNLGDTQPISI